MRPLRSLLLTTVGSTGDVVPHLALALAAQARGHRVRVASHAFHRASFERANVAFVQVGGDLTVADFNAMVDRAAREKAPIKQYDVLVRSLFLAEPERRFAELRAAAAEADLVISQRFDYLGQEAALAAGVPWVSVTPAPQLIATQEAPVYPAPDLGKLWRQFTWITLEQMAKPTNEHVARVLAALGAPPRKLDVAGASSPRLDLVPASPALVAVRGDWPTSVRATGAWVVPARADQRLEPALAAFLDTHERPIVVTFGSMGGSGADETARLILDTLARLGKPAVVQAGYSGLLSGAALPANVLAVGHVPHELLFARAGCVVHHAGAGTSHAVIAAGVPSAPVPHLFDQYYWAGRLADVGVAPKPLFRHQASPKKLAARIEEALGLAEAARALAVRVRADPGVAGAIEAIEAL